MAEVWGRAVGGSIGQQPEWRQDEIIFAASLCSSSLLQTQTMDARIDSRAPSVEGNDNADINAPLKAAPKLVAPEPGISHSLISPSIRELIFHLPDKPPDPLALLPFKSLFRNVFTITNPLSQNTALVPNRKAPARAMLAPAVQTSKSALPLPKAPIPTFPSSLPVLRPSSTRFSSSVAREASASPPSPPC